MNKASWPENLILLYANNRGEYYSFSGVGEKLCSCTHCTCKQVTQQILLDSVVLFRRSDFAHLGDT